MALNDYEQSVLDNIAKHGWFCVMVGCNYEDEGPSFAYTVGFEQTLSSPECIIFGLPLELMHSMLWEVFRQVREGAVLSDGRRLSGLIEGFDCVSREVDSSKIEREYFNSALWHWGDPVERGRPMRAFQLVWPGSKDGLFPWQSGCAQVVKDHQTALYLPVGGGSA